MKRHTRRILLGLSIIAMLALPPTALALPGIPGTQSEHQIQAGETLSSIAARYQTSIEALSIANGIHNVNLIQVGSYLVIPDSTGSGTTPAQPVRSMDPLRPPASAPIIGPWQGTDTDCAPSYTVKPGDTLSTIADRCGMSLTGILNANGLSMNSIIYAGQRISLPGSTAQESLSVSAEPGRNVSSGEPVSAEPATSACMNPHRVQPGDTLFQIALRCSVSVDDLRAWNNLASEMIYSGQSLTTSGIRAVDETPDLPPTPSSYPETVIGSRQVIVPEVPTPAFQPPTVVAPTPVQPPAAPTPAPPALPTPTPAVEPTIAP